MSVDPEIEAKCKEISTNYSACDVSSILQSKHQFPTTFLPTTKAAKQKSVGTREESKNKEKI